MINKNIWTKEEELIFNENLNKDISNAWERAMNDSYPSDKSTLNHVYSSPKGT